MTITASAPFDFGGVKPSGIDATSAPRETIGQAAGYIADRLDRVADALGDLNGVVMRAGTDLESILRDGGYTDPPSEGELRSGPTPGRSAHAAYLLNLGDRADELADLVTQVRRRLEAVLDAVEL